MNFSEAIIECARFAQTNPSREILNVGIDVVDGGAIVTGTDGARAMRVICELDHEVPPGDYTVPTSRWPKLGANPWRVRLVADGLELESLTAAGNQTAKTKAKDRCVEMIPRAATVTKLWPRLISEPRITLPVGSALDIADALEPLDCDAQIGLFHADDGTCITVGPYTLRVCDSEPHAHLLFAAGRLEDALEPFSSAAAVWLPRTDPYAPVVIKQGELTSLVMPLTRRG